MKWVADENIDRQLVEMLRTSGHEVVYIAEIEPAADDPDVLERASKAAAILLTGDKDFGELVYRMKKVAYGVVLLRLHGLAPEVKANLLASVLKDHLADLPGSFTGISHESIRVRKLT